MKWFNPFVTMLVGGLCMINSIHAEKFPYKDASLPTSQRVNDLLSRMTVEEKVGQLLCVLGWDMYEIKGDKVIVSDKFKELVKRSAAGMLWATYRADPWTKKNVGKWFESGTGCKSWQRIAKICVG